MNGHAAGSVADAAVTDPTLNATIIALLKGLITLLSAGGGGTVLVPEPLSVDDNADSLTVDDGGTSLTVDGPLTDTQLRATAVPVADGGGSLTVDGPLTDTQLRATAVPVADGGSSLTVDGPLTDTQLRATAVPVGDGGATLSIDDGAGNISIDDGGNTITVDGTVTANQGTAGAAAWPVKDQWTLSLQADENADDSDKTFTVPASTEWQVLFLWVELTTTATVGNRQLCVEIQDSSSDVIAQWRAGAVQAASLTRYYNFAPANADLESFRDTDYLSTPITPMIILPAAYKIRVYDKAAVAAAADDMIVQLMVAALSV